MTDTTIPKCADCMVQDTLIPYATNEGTSKLLCSFCYTQYVKGKIVECDCCPNKVAERAIKTFADMKMCPSCHATEIRLQAENNTPEKQQERVDSLHEALDRSRAIDSAISVRTDLFNAATTAIVDLRQIIESDDTIINKNFKLAEELMARFEHFKSVVFEANAAIVEATNNQKAIQVYLNQLANSLRAEEREKLKIQDLNYKPKEVKPVKPRAVKTAKAKLNKGDLRKYAAELGVSEFTLQMLVVSKGITVEAAANMLRKSVKEAISESTPDNLPAVDMDAIKEIE